MAALQAGDDRALNVLMERWRDRVGAFLLRMTGSATTAVDLTQETFVKLYLSRGRFRSGSPFPAWLFTIAANLARNHARWLRRHPTVSLEEAPVQGGGTNPDPAHPRGGTTPDAEAVTSESLSAIRTAFAALPADLREAMALFVDEDMSYRDIAQVTGSSPKAVEMRIYRARQLLKASLAPLRDSRTG